MWSRYAGKRVGSLLWQAAGPRLRGAVDSCLAQRLHSEVSLPFPHVQAEMKVGQRRDRVQARPVTSASLCSAARKLQSCGEASVYR